MSNSTRMTRFYGRAALHRSSTVDACTKCGRVSIIPGGSVGVRITNAGVVGFAGLASCGRIWLCPVCNSKIMALRAIEIGAALMWAQQHGLWVLWGSFTTQHHGGMTLKPQLAVQAAGWRFLVNSWGWREDSLTRTVPHECSAGCSADCERKRDTILRAESDKLEGRVGYIRAAEITTGGHGWHPHFHPLILWRGSKESAQAAAEVYRLEWVAGVLASGGKASGAVDDNGEGPQRLDVLEPDAALVALAKYVTKAVYEGLSTAEREARAFARAELRDRNRTLGLEAVWSQSKDGKAGGRGARFTKTVSHWELLDRIAAGDLDGTATPAWWELEKATKGHRAVVWSRGLRSFAGLLVEKTDEEVASEEVGDKDDTVCMITPTGWRIMRDHPDVVACVLDTLERGGWRALR